MTWRKEKHIIYEEDMGTLNNGIYQIDTKDVDI